MSFVQLACVFHPMGGRPALIEPGLTSTWTIYGALQSASAGDEYNWASFCQMNGWHKWSAVRNRTQLKRAAIVLIAHVTCPPRCPQHHSSQLTSRTEIIL